MNKKEKKEFRENVEFQNELVEESEERLDKDFERIPIASPIPEDSVQLLHQRSIPDGRDDFPRLINRNTTLANYQEKKPDPVYHELLVGTSVLVRDIFVIDEEVLEKDAEGNLYPIYEKEPVFNDKTLIGWKLKRDANGKPIIMDYVKRIERRFDQNFQVICNFLDGTHMFGEASSRAMGKNPENVLSRSNIISKNIGKSDSGQPNRGF